MNKYSNSNKISSNQFFDRDEEQQHEEDSTFF